MRKYFLNALLLITSTVLISSCQKEKLGEGNDEELITTVELKFKPVNGGPALSFRFRDLDGDGGAAPETDTIVLDASTQYNVNVLVLNEAESPAEDITTEVMEEADAHRFYYTDNSETHLLIDSLDTDDDNMPLGITSRWQTRAAGTGAVLVTLRHYIGSPPDKQLSDNIASPKAVTDISIPFPYRVE